MPDQIEASCTVVRNVCEARVCRYTVYKCRYTWSHTNIGGTHTHTHKHTHVHTYMYTYMYTHTFTKHTHKTYTHSVHVPLPSFTLVLPVDCTMRLPLSTDTSLHSPLSFAFTTPRAAVMLSSTRTTVRWTLTRVTICGWYWGLCYRDWRERDKVTLSEKDGVWMCVCVCVCVCVWERERERERERNEYSR